MLLVVTIAAAPVVLGAVGFTSAGIASGSIAASMMSSAAIAKGGGVAAGSLVAILQSAGATGIPVVAKLGLGTVGAFIAALFLKCWKVKIPEDN
ncbi:interferon alpha-inducible protein 27, mitochondrial-like isoform X2 [Rhincodon typus]|uniref:interferon alpha-inducible protein 27, mitochondrial-like isoform X2 n=1 Tax=Rhincodon typus TaxID=259920 RepID=UPI0020301E9E|nr:interferon alpha-inducible protein 27, mitochondrial-like isoform X2 [Rhincodon typus]